MSWLFSQALVEEYLGENSLDGEPSAPLNGNPTQLAFCAPDKMTVFSRLSRFGMTYKPLTDIPGEELLMSYLAGFPARTSHPQEKVQESTESGQECGNKWHGSFAKYDQDSCSWKTHQCSLLGDLDEFSEIWPQWGLMRNGECWEQQTLAHRIKGTGFGLLEKLPTPQATDYKDKPTSKSWKAKGGINFSLANPEIRATWPTPTVCGNYNRKGASKSSGDGLATAVVKRMWPTPNAGNEKWGGTMYEWGGSKNWVREQMPELASGALNPMWVEWLMGWPLGWTDLKPLEMDKSHCVQPKPGDC